jgi:hypothetical protein
VNAGLEETDVSNQTGQNMATLKKEMGLKEIVVKQEDYGRSLKSKFEVFGEEMIEKEVKQSGNTGRVYLPPYWAGKRVKIIRID